MNSAQHCLGPKKRSATAAFRKFLSAGGALTASFALAGAAGLLTPQPARAQDDDAPTSVSLAGSWLEHAGDNENWRRVDAPETDWQKVTLPGASTTAGYTWYRKHFTLPAAWTDNNLAKQNQLYLHLGAFHGAAAFYLNGYTINTVGNLPSNAGGSGYKPVPTTSDLTLVVPITAPVQGSGKDQQLVTLGGDNVLAIRVYDPTAEGNPASGDLKIDLPTVGELFPVTTQFSNQDHIYDNKAPVAFSVLHSDDSANAATASWYVDILSDAGDSVIPPPNPTKTNLDPSTISKHDVSYDLAGAGAPAGFYTFVVSTRIGDTHLDPQQFVAGVDPSAIRSDMTAPNGFGAFWNTLESAAASGSLSPQINKDAAASTPDVSVYRVTYAGLGGQPALAWLSVPTHLAASPVAVLHIPAYKEDPTAPSLDIAKRGYVVMDMIATAPDFTSGNANSDYFSTGLESPANYVYRRVEGNALRAARLLTGGALPGVTGTPKLVLWGESVGGALALDSAGLLKDKVSAVVAISPYFSDIARTISHVQPQNDPFHSYLTSHPNSRPQVNATLGTFDTVQFAPKITAPTFVAVGLEDPVALPYGEYAAINELTAPHTVDVEPDAGHIPAPSHDKALAWLASTVK